MRAGLATLVCALWPLAVYAQVSEPAEAPPGDVETLVVTGERARPDPVEGPAPVEVLDTETARVEAADMGAFLNRARGVNIRRRGGLGSASDFTLHGLGGRRVRFFVDGLPLALSAFGDEPSALPVNLIEQVEIYKGVVPVEFGVDALGGLVHFVTDRLPTEEPVVDASYEIGAFGTHRASLVARAPLGERGPTLGVTAFADRTDNDYPVEVEVSEMGRPRTVTVERFHDAYAGWGGSLDLLVAERVWAERLTLRGFLGGLDKDIQHDTEMVTPYGDATREETRQGAVAHYVSPLLPGGLTVELLANYTTRAQVFTDISRNRYDWFGDVVDRRPFPGEATEGRRTTIDTDTVEGRLGVGWQMASNHALRLTVAPSHADVIQTTERADGSDTPAERAEQRRTALIGGLAYDVELWGGRITNSAFVKGYRLTAAAPRSLLEGGGEASRTTDQYGGGDMLRVDVIDGIRLKASYEYTTRLPAVAELFGDGGVVLTNPALRPEVSHNINLGVRLAADDVTLGGVDLGDFALEVDGFRRDTRDLIFLVVTTFTASYDNVARSETMGVEAGGRWTYADRLTLGLNATWVDARNRSQDGQFARFDGDRIPNLPYLYGNGSVSYAMPDLFVARDRLRVYWHGRHVTEYFRFWEGEGRVETKQVIPAQTMHDVGVSYGWGDGAAALTVEARNVGSERAFDTYGVELPGRSWHLKAVVYVE